MSKLLQAWSLGCGRSVVVGLIAVAIVLPLGGACVLLPLWLVMEVDVGIWLLAVSASLYLLILNGGALGAAAWILRRRKRRLDATFTPLGLAGERYMVTGRRYRGTIRGRQVRVRFYRGPMLGMEVSTTLQTRMSVAERGSTALPLGRVLGREPLSLDHPELDGLSVFALDRRWARSLLDDPEVRGVVRRLMQAGQEWALVRQVVLAPGAVEKGDSRPWTYRCAPSTPASRSGTPGC